MVPFNGCNGKHQMFLTAKNQKPFLGTPPALQKAGLSAETFPTK